MALLRTASRNRIEVPAELRIIGMGNIAEGLISHPQLTSLGIDDPDYSIAINHLLDRIDDPHIDPAGFDHPWQLMIRQTG